MMPHYSLAIVNEPGRVLSTPAKDREEALTIFGKELGKRLTLDEKKMVADYVLDEWHEGEGCITAVITISL